MMYGSSTLLGLQIEKFALKKFEFNLLVEVKELTSLIGFYININLIYRMTCGCLKRMDVWELH